MDGPPECRGHSHDHDHDDHLGLSLRPQIDFTGVRCLNEEVAGSGARVLKLHEERLSQSPFVTSPEDDPELLFHIPFTEPVSIHSIAVRSGIARDAVDYVTAAPRQIKLFADRNDVDFATARELPPQQQLTLVPPDHLPDGTVDYPLRPATRFANISSLTVYIANNYASVGGDDDDMDEEVATEITFLGLKGVGTGIRCGPVHTVYESRPMAKDHKMPGDEYGSRSFV